MFSSLSAKRGTTAIPSFGTKFTRIASKSLLSPPLALTRRFALSLLKALLKAKRVGQ